MSNYYYGMNKGQEYKDAVVGTSTNSTGIEIFVTGASFTEKIDVLRALEQLEDFIIKSNYPPA
jgi:hypothetical protein